MVNAIVTLFIAHPVIFSLVCLILIIGSVVISLRGKAMITWGKVSIGLGESRDKTSFKRTCGDCIMLLFGKREALQSSLDLVQKNILKQQMNIAEQKLLECQVELLQTYRSSLTEKRDQDIEIDYNREDREYKIYEGALLQAFNCVKDEVRRAFKENGFEDLSGKDFADYVMSKIQLLIGISTSYIDGKYPISGMIIERQEWRKYIQSIYVHRIEELCFNVFELAKDIKKDSISNSDKLKAQFAEDINTIVGKK